MKKYKEFINESEDEYGFASDYLFKKAFLNIENGGNKADLVKMKRALDMGANIDFIIEDFYKKTALHISVQKGWSNMVSFLIENGANPNLYDKYGQTPLMSAIQMGYLNIARYLIRKGASIKFNTPDNENIWMYAGRKARLDNMMYILDYKGIDINHKNKYGQNILDVLYRCVNSNKSFNILAERYLKEHPYEAYKYIDKLSPELREKYKEYIVLGRDFDIFESKEILEIDGIYQAYMMRLNFFLYGNRFTFDETNILDSYIVRKGFMEGLEKFLKNHPEEIGNLSRVIQERNGIKDHAVKKYLPEFVWKPLYALRDDFDFFD